MKQTTSLGVSTVPYQEIPIFQGTKVKNSRQDEREKNRLPDILFMFVNGGAAMNRIHKLQTSK